MNAENRTTVIGGRLMSIDALRGFDMFWITGGGTIVAAFIKAGKIGFLNNFILPQLGHARWEGFTFTDLIMPLFLFMAGASIPFSFSKRLSRGDSKKQLYLHIVKRVVVLAILGIVAQGDLFAYENFSRRHIFGNVLQGIAVGYLVASVFFLNMKVVWQVITTAAILLLFWAVMMMVPVPGYGAGDLSPEGNLSIYIDKLILGRFCCTTSSWQYPFILTTMMFGCISVWGSLAGQLLRSQKSQKAKVVQLLAIGLGCLLVGWLWSNWFPLNRHYWSSSMVVLSIGWCYLLLGIFYLIIDVCGFRKWAFGFVVIGMNTIAIYMVVRSGFFNSNQVGDFFVGALADRLGEWYVFARRAIAFIILWLILYWMYRKKTFIRV